MTALTDLLSALRSHINRSDLSDDTVTTWVRFAEERMNNELRVAEMIVRANIQMTDNVIALPPDWLEGEYLKYVPTQTPDTNDGSVYGGPHVYNYDILYGRPIHYCTTDEYYAAQNDTGNPLHYQSYYTIIGGQLFVSPAPDPTLGRDYEMAYFGRVPPLDATNKVYERFPSLYLNASLVYSAPFLADDERVTMWAEFATATITNANMVYDKSKRGNGPLHVRRRSFG
jgi:hypothetical protein